LRLVDILDFTIMETVNDITYNHVLEEIFSRHKAFCQIGAEAYHPGIETTLELAAAFSNPHRSFPTIHIAGTNGKGSTASLLASVLTASGYKTGLYTSPHLVDFAERIRIDGKPIPHDYVVDFVYRFKKMGFKGCPSFFELSTVMAFEYFARENVDIAVIEAGLGGRLDSTNIISPLLSIITNISLDHTAILGNSLQAIAYEKAGIIKPGIPVIVGETSSETKPVFVARASEMRAPLFFADEAFRFDAVFQKNECGSMSQGKMISVSEEYDNHGNVITHYYNTPWGTLVSPLSGIYQWNNAATVFSAIKTMESVGLHVYEEAVRTGFEHVCELSGLVGRWSVLPGKPAVVYDTGHNIGAWLHLGPRLKVVAKTRTLALILGFVSDKDFTSIMHTLPAECHIFVVQPPCERAASSAKVTEAALNCGLTADDCRDLDLALKKALALVGEDGMVFVGGSNYVVAELLKTS